MALRKNRFTARTFSLNGFPKKIVTQLLETALEIIKSTIESDEPIMISRFGKFQGKNNNDRGGSNAQTGKSLIVDAKRAVTFKCSDH